MKKKILLVGAILLLLVGSFFAGERPATEKKSVPESLPEEVQVLPTEEAEEIEALADKEEKTLEKKDTETDSGEQTKGSVAEEYFKESEENLPGVEETTASDEENICTLSVRCDAIFENMESLSAGKESLVPKNGIIYPEQQVEFTQGESVFDVLYREMRENKIHFEFVKTPMYNSVYIEGIGNLYEFDCGEYSGWIYRVNGVKPNVGCSQHQVRKGDIITVSYTCNFLKER